MPGIPWGQGRGAGAQQISSYLGNEGQRAFELLRHDNALNGEHKLGLIGDT